MVLIPERDSIPPDCILPFPPIPLHEPEMSAVVGVIGPSSWLQDQLGHMSFDFFALLTALDEKAGIDTRRYCINAHGEGEFRLDHQLSYTIPARYLFLTSPRTKPLTEYNPGMMLPLTTTSFSVQYAYVEPSGGYDSSESSSRSSRITVLQAEDHKLPRLVQDVLLCGASGRSWYSSATGDGVVIRVVDYHSFLSSSPF
jgi:hypothetical protein